MRRRSALEKLDPVWRKENITASIPGDVACLGS
jgi:hypothetical protein